MADHGNEASDDFVHDVETFKGGLDVSQETSFEKLEKGGDVEWSRCPPSSLPFSFPWS